MKLKSIFVLLFVFFNLTPVIGQKPYSKKRQDSDTKFEWIEFSNGRKMGAKTLSGRIIIPCLYDNVYYSNHCFSATNKTAKTAILYNENGKILIPSNRGYNRFSLYNLMDNGYFVAYKGNKAELLDSTFKVAIPESRGYTDYTSIHPKKYGYLTAKIGKNAELLNSTFQVTIPVSRGYTYFDVSDLKKYGYCVAKRDTLAVLLNSQFQEVVPASRGYSYYDLYYLKEYGYCIAKKGEFKALLNSQFQELVPASRGYTDFDIYKMKNYGYCLAKKGGFKALLNSQFQELVPASRGYTDFEVSDLKNYGYCEAKKDTLAVLLNSQFQEVIPASRGYKRIDAYESKKGLLRVYKGGLYGLCDLQGKELLPPVYKFINVMISEISYEKQDGTKGDYKFSRYGNTVTIHNYSNSSMAYSSSSATDELIYKGLYTVTGWSYNYSQRQYSSTGIAGLKQIEIYRDRFVVDGKSEYFWKTDGQWRCYGQDKNHPIFLYNTATGEVRNRFVFNFYGQHISDIIWVRGDQVAAYTGTGTSNPVYSSHSNTGSSSSGSVLTTKTCGYCNGRGWIPTDEGVSTFGNTNSKWCRECGRTVPSNHWHKTCPSCNGKGSYQSVK